MFACCGASWTVFACAVASAAAEPLARPDRFAPFVKRRFAGTAGSRATEGAGSHEEIQQRHVEDGRGSGSLGPWV